ncbi:hypothetical protein BN1058_00842 [Paraliobacillus sp. PM-2]|nr:hypothetical protein BN1058_00842 [Paraliobacillus sp. PM-2]
MKRRVRSILVILGLFSLGLTLPLVVHAATADDVVNMSYDSSVDRYYAYGYGNDMDSRFLLNPTTDLGYDRNMYLNLRSTMKDSVYPYFQIAYDPSYVRYNWFAVNMGQTYQDNTPVITIAQKDSSTELLTVDYGSTYKIYDSGDIASVTVAMESLKSSSEVYYWNEENYNGYTLEAGWDDNNVTVYKSAQVATDDYMRIN